jgi:undecaprenyl diphosphate synthase
MKLFESWIGDFLIIFKDKNVKIRVIGQKWRVPESLQREIERVESLTCDKNGMTLNIALSYGGRDEIVDAVKKIVENGTLPEKITEKLISENLWVSDVDLIIRTGGEQRLSGFLAWQATYAELFFIKKYLPDFKPTDFEAILAEYAQRQRRFGK